MSGSIEAFIVGELGKKGIPYKIGRDWVQTYCPFHAYSDRITHLGIRKDGKFIHCFSCGRKGTWNDYAREKNLEEITEEFRKENVFNDLLYDLHRTFEKEEYIQLPYNEPLDIPWNRYSTEDNYRGPDLPISFLRKFKITKYYDDKCNEYRLLLPVFMEKELVGWSTLWVSEEETKEKSINMPGPWARDAFYPLDYVKRANFVVLVEGQYDALRLIYDKVPALSILGTPNWQSDLVKLLQVYNFKHVFVLMDGDPPGRKAGEMIYNDIVGKLPVTLLDMPLDSDPGNLNQEEVCTLKKLLKKSRKKDYLEIESL